MERIAGLQLGLLLQLAIVAVGLGAAVARSMTAFTIIKWAGVAYLITLAVRQWRAPTEDLGDGIEMADGGRFKPLMRGFLVNMTNPKALVFLLAVLPPFIEPAATAAAAVSSDRRDDGRRRRHRHVRIHRPGLHGCWAAAHAPPADHRQPDHVGAVRHRGTGAVIGSARRRLDGSGTMEPMRAEDHPNNAPGVPMKFPPWFEKLQIKYMNPIAVPIARFMPGITVIKHRGRTSGKEYETAISAYRKGRTVAIMLAHGKTNWVKNILAAA